MALTLVLIALFAFASGLAIETYRRIPWHASSSQRCAARIGSGAAAAVALGSLVGAVHMLENLPH